MNTEVKQHKVFWKPSEYDMVSLAFAKSIKESTGIKLPLDRHMEIAQKVLEPNRRRPTSSLASERATMRKHGIVLMEQEVVQVSRSKIIAESAVAVTTARPTLSVKPISINPAPMSESDDEAAMVKLNSLDSLSETLVNAAKAEQAVADYIRVSLPDMLKRIMIRTEERLEVQVNAQVDAFIANGEHGVSISFFSKAFDPQDHSELPTAAAASVSITTPAKRVMNVGIVGLMPLQMQEVTKNFKSSEVYFRFLNRENGKQAAKSAVNMHHVVVAVDHCNHSVVEAIVKKLNPQGKVHNVKGHAESIIAKVRELLAQQK